ncbi:hypothetical protein C8J56DRAFT_917917 [Mycena floridula]|nr:hypothetical protein C8J56DRAFT_917917 [Mycena floridula]
MDQLYYSSQPPSLSSSTSSSPASACSSLPALECGVSIDLDHISSFERSFCSDFICCSSRFPDLHELIDHFEEHHIIVQSPEGKPVFPNKATAESCTRLSHSPSSTYFAAYPPGAFDGKYMRSNVLGVAYPSFPVASKLPLPQYSLDQRNDIKSVTPQPVIETPSIITLQPLTSAVLVREPSPEPLIDPEPVPEPMEVVVTVPSMTRPEPMIVDTVSELSAPSRAPSLIPETQLDSLSPASGPQRSKKKGRPARLSVASGSAEQDKPRGKKKTVSKALKREKAIPCPKSGCIKTYRNLNGLKYHQEKGKCAFEEADSESRSSSPSPRVELPMASSPSILSPLINLGLTSDIFDATYPPRTRRSTRQQTQQPTASLDFSSDEDL